MPYETPLMFNHSNEMETQEACPGFMVLEENIAEEDENFAIDWY